MHLLHQRSNIKKTLPGVLMWTKSNLIGVENITVTGGELVYLPFNHLARFQWPTIHFLYMQFHGGKTVNYFPMHCTCLHLKTALITAKIGRPGCTICSWMCTVLSAPLMSHALHFSSTVTNIIIRPSSSIIMRFYTGFITQYWKYA